MNIDEYYTNIKINKRWDEIDKALSHSDADYNIARSAQRILQQMTLAKARGRGGSSFDNGLRRVQTILKFANSSDVDKAKLQEVIEAHNRQFGKEFGLLPSVGGANQYTAPRSQKSKDLQKQRTNAFVNAIGSTDTAKKIKSGAQNLYENAKNAAYQSERRKMQNATMEKKIAAEYAAEQAGKNASGRNDVKNYAYQRERRKLQNETMEKEIAKQYAAEQAEKASFGTTEDVRNWLDKKRITNANDATIQRIREYATADHFGDRRNIRPRMDKLKKKRAKDLSKIFKDNSRITDF